MPEWQESQLRPDEWAIFFRGRLIANYVKDPAGLWAAGIGYGRDLGFFVTCEQARAVAWGWVKAAYPEPDPPTVVPSAFLGPPL